MDKESIKIEVSEILYNRVIELNKRNPNLDIFKVLHDIYKADEAGFDLSVDEKKEVIVMVLAKLFFDSFK